MVSTEQTKNQGVRGEMPALQMRLVTTNPEYAKICRRSLQRIPKAKRSRVSVLAFPDWDEVDVPRGDERKTITIFISRVADIVEDAAKKARDAGRVRHLLFSEGMPVESLASRLAPLDIRDARRLHIAREQDPASIAEMLVRLVRVMAQSKRAGRILDAWVEENELVLLSPSFERLRVPIGKLEKYLGKAKGKIRDFEIDEDGSFLFWPHADVHLGWDQVMHIIDPASAVTAKEKTDEFNKKYGAAIRSLREESGLKQTEVEGLTDRHLRRIEQGKQAATSGALKTLANAPALTCKSI